jgi:hypothetical protein
MRSCWRSTIQRNVVIVVLGALSSAYAGVHAPLPMTTLQEKADLIVVATVQQVVGGTGGRQTISLQVQRTIQGSPTSTLVIAVLEPPADPAFSFPNGVLSKDVIGRTGVWFLVLSGSGYQVFPVVHGTYVRDADIYVPVPVSGLSVEPAVGKTINQELVAYAIQSYLATASPGGAADDLLLPSLLSLSPQDAVAAVGPLVSSASVEHRAFGLSVAIRFGSDSAISGVAADVTRLKNSAKAPLIVTAIKEYQPHGEASIAVLKQLIGLNSGAAGIEGAAAAALAKIASRSVMPVMISLLDSPESEAVLRAATFCGFYTLFADAKGNLNLAQNGSLLGPLSTTDTKAYTPSAGSLVAPSQYAQFWKSWWSKNKQELGFTAP